MPRGGRRPGAGAPKGNWNALSSGGRSKRLRALVLSLRDDPHFMAVYRLLKAAAGRQQGRRAKTLQSLLDLERALTNDRKRDEAPGEAISAPEIDEGEGSTETLTARSQQQ